ncbi:MAG: FAD-dependent oxidoreductase [Planctomycetaceae bacterium]|nr:FAD-dependent oxidoreductase [Planctomycetaceae bacterium]MBT6156968.1 FAD-dependent oxidoreductase [Planctomycetaceae bacterium]MBT6484463.1 FAD-dependent oxidoreductase [Planctomycetaceae bacterium]MBT6494892.1 FAD-dependent oxidoreductase [Planctomycetaceae bacterium]
MPENVIIVGGGLSGLAAACALAERGVRVTLLESRPRLGGRAGSFTDRTTGTQIDNCQHVTMGCCTNFQKFCDTVGVSELFRRETQLNFVGPDGSIDTLASSWLPAPLHLFGGFRRLRYLSRADRRCLSRGLRSLARTRPANDDRQTFADWLREHRQTPTAIERFWKVVLVSALSETLDRIDVASARKVFVDAFLANRRGWEVQIPTVPLDELYGSRLTDWLTNRHATIRLKCGVEQLLVEDDRVKAVELRGDERLDADEFILAVPHQRVAALLPESLRTIPEVAGLDCLESAPIASVHLWFDRPLTDLPHAAFLERLSQWMFNRTELQSDDVSTPPHYYYQIVISASRSIAGMTQEQVIETVVAELAEVWPAVGEAQLVHSRLVTEQKAVFSVLPGADAWRPAQQSFIANLQFAGDWTRTGWPATMEGAVRSGYLAAENVLARLGRPEKLLAPDLPTAPLSKILLGL